MKDWTLSVHNLSNKLTNIVHNMNIFNLHGVRVEETENRAKKFGSLVEGNKNQNCSNENIAAAYNWLKRNTDWSEDTIFGQDRYQSTALHWACEYRAPLQIVKILLDNFDKKLTWATDISGSSALHAACKHAAPMEIIEAIITDQYGKYLQSTKNYEGKLPFDHLPEDESSRREYLKDILRLAKAMQEKDPTGDSYPRGLFTSILNLPTKDRSNVMNNSYLRTLLNLEIVKPFSLFVLNLDVGAQLLVTFLFSFSYSGFGEVAISTRPLVLLVPCLVWLLFRELVQICSTTLNSYLLQSSNFVDLVQIGLIGAVIATGIIEGEDRGIYKGHLAVCIGVSWVRLIYIFAALNYKVAVIIDEFIAVFQGLIPFLFIVSMICAAAAHMYHAIRPLDDVQCDDVDVGWTCNLRNSYFHAFAMVLTGDWRFMDNFIDDLSYLSIVFSFLGGVILMNMAIALIAKIFTELETRNKTAFWVSRLRYINELDTIRSLGRWMTFCSLGRKERVEYHNRKMEELSVDKTRASVLPPRLSVLPPRLSMDGYQKKNIDSWMKVDRKSTKLLLWYWSIDGGATSMPSFPIRIWAYLSMAKWSQIFFMSKSFRLCFMGVSRNEINEITFMKQVNAWIGCSAIIMLIYLKNILLTPIGLVTGGYFWPREAKEYLFYGAMNDESVLNGEMGLLKEQVNAKVDSVKEQMKKQNEDMAHKVEKLLQAMEELNSKISRVQVEC